MKEKKQFYIPKNYHTGFEWIPGISGIQHWFFVPSIFISYATFKYLDIAMDNKVLISLGSLALPYALCIIKGPRENIPLYKVLYWKFKFMQRQKKYHYKKEGYVNVQLIQERNNNTGHTIKTAEEARGSRKEKHTRSHSYKGNKGRGVNYSG